VALKAGERMVVNITVRRNDLCHWDSAAQAWMLEPGKVQLLVVGSSAELPLRCETEL